jgi:hypothetical protein
MKVVLYVILVLILLSQLYLGFIGTALLKQDRLENVDTGAVPLKLFNNFLTERKNTDIVFIGWRIEGDECVVLVRKQYSNTGREYGDSEHFVRMQTGSGYGWFYNNMGEYIPVTGGY